MRRVSEYESGDLLINCNLAVANEASLQGLTDCGSKAPYFKVGMNTYNSPPVSIPSNPSFVCSDLALAIPNHVSAAVNVTEHSFALL